MAYLHFDSQDFLDAYGDFDGTPRGTAPIAFVDGKAGFGKAIKLNGDNQFVEITGGAPDDLAFAGGSMSIAGWFKVDLFDTSWQALVAKGEGNNWRVHRRGGETGFAHAGGTGEGPAGIAVNDGLWHHFAAISDAAAVNFGTALYVDGAIYTQNASTPNLTANGKRMMIGENPDARNREWEGCIDDVAVWNRVLTAEEIAALYNNGDGASLRSLFKTKIEVLGVGAGALLGGDLTDPENDGNEAAGPLDPSWNWAGITSSHEPFFNGAEGSFNIFDNLVGGGAAKWCCDDPTPGNPVWVAVLFPRPVSLTHFTMTSGNDTPGRDPTDFAIQGSADGVDYTDIYHLTSITDPVLPWTRRNEVVKFTLPEASAPYLFIRYIAYETPATLHQLNEIEYFGTSGGVSLPRVSKLTSDRNSVTFEITDGADTSLVPGSVALKIDDAAAPSTVEKVGMITSVKHAPSPRFEFGSVHTYEIQAKDNFNNPLKFVGSFTLATPWFPEADLPSPDVVDGMFATRYVFSSGTIDSIPSALSRLVAAGDGEMLPDGSGNVPGMFVDVVNQVINHGNGGFNGNNLPYNEEATALGCCGNDFIQFSVGNIKILEESDYTFGVQSDDGFALRIRGGTAVAVSGNGQLDPADPEAVVHPANTGNSDTRGVYHLKPGVYRLEFFWWERGGGDFGELYAAKGRFANNGDTTTWKLVGDPTPSQDFFVLGVDAAGWSVVSSDPGGDPLNNWDGANADLEATAGDPVIYDALNVGDPDTNGGPLPFPKNAPGDDNDYALRATAKLVVPADGTYTIGFNTDDGGYVKIPGHDFDAVIVVGAGGAIDPNSPDTVICNCLTGDSNVRADITLGAGTYDIEFGMFERGGGSFLRGSGAQSGSPQLPTLAKNGAGVITTATALQLTSAPVGLADLITKIEIVGANVVITYKPLDPGTYKLARSTNLNTWTVLPTVPVAAGDKLVFTVARGADANVFFQVQH